MGSIGEEDQRLLLAAALKQAGYTVGDLWLRFFAIGGSIGEYEVEAYLSGLILLPALQRDLLAHAANELIGELPPPLQAPYSDDAENGIESGDGDRGARGTFSGDQRNDIWNVDARKLESADGDPEQGAPDSR
ncbi:hypothetical protein [Arthrobacter sp. H41]|uniref:hypothetical protein n=1 Tax=Arthrobacter sp. H41 TaxID=1312978 RepID=UPI0004B7CDE0|nr:hypothetical protein [Arthrobacter sp. H41]